MYVLILNDELCLLIVYVCLKFCFLSLIFVRSFCKGFQAQKEENWYILLLLLLLLLLLFRGLPVLHQVVLDLRRIALKVKQYNKSNLMC